MLYYLGKQGGDMLDHAGKPSYLGVNRYPPQQVLNELQDVGICPHAMHQLGIFVRAYAWHHGALALARCNRLARKRVARDFEEYQKYDVLPEYVQRAYEQLVLAKMAEDDTAAASP